MSPPSVLQIGKFYPPHMGGIETHLETLCRQLSGAYDVRVIASNHRPGESTETRHGIPVTRLATPFSITSAPVNPSLPSAVRARNPDLIHIHLPHPGGVLGLLASGYRGPLVVTYHSDVVRQKMMSGIFAPFLHRLLGRAAIVIATSSRYVDSSPVLQRYRSRIRVVPYGIACRQCTDDDRRKAAEIRQQFGPRLILAVGRFVYYKGFEYAVRAMRRVDGHLVLIGDGALRTALERETHTCDVSSRVTFLGEMQNEEVVPFFQAADVFILPSIARSEAFGIVQIEAMSAGRPVVNTSLDSGVPWVSQQGVTGLTVPPGDADALAAAINTLLDDEPLREKLGAAGPNRVKSEFTAELMARRIRAIYDEVLA